MAAFDAGCWSGVAACRIEKLMIAGDSWWLVCFLLLYEVQNLKTKKAYMMPYMAGLCDPSSSDSVDCMLSDQKGKTGDN